MDFEILALWHLKSLITYNKAHGISTMKKQLEQNHVALLKSFKNE
jgi:hypothetical protein